MTTGNQELAELIRNEIRQRGPMPFARFMELALYHPEHGYYSGGRAAIGRRGDYITNVSVGPLFGQLLTAQFIEIHERLGSSENFTIVEQGAHDGQFAYDVLAAIRSRAPELFEATHYRIVEPFAVLRARQQETLQLFRENVKWAEELSSSKKSIPHLHPLPKGEADAKRRVRVKSLEPFTGIHFSNELLDAMPVDLRDKSVALQDDHFVFAEQTSDHHSVPNASQLSWIDALAAKLQRGVAIIVDYGFVRSEFREVVQARAHHQLLDSPFEQIGDADISVHLNWTDIAERAQVRGFEIAGFTDQHHFITGIISTWPDLLHPHRPNNLTALSNQVPGDRSDPKMSRELQTLLHPEMLGRAFQILALSKGLDLGEPLAGFRFAREPCQTLELEKWARQI